MMQGDRLIATLERLRESRIWFTIHYVREGAVSVLACVPGERWEIDFLQDGTIDVEVFKSDGTISGEPRLEELFAKR